MLRTGGEARTRLALVTALLTIALTACGWPMGREGPARTGFNPLESTLSVENVGSLQESWTAELGGGDALASPAVFGNRVYAGSWEEGLDVFDANGCPGTDPVCEPLWHGDTGRRVAFAPAVADGIVYVVAGHYTTDGVLYAFDADGVDGCSGAPKHCAPLWTGVAPGFVSGDPAVIGGRVYVGSQNGMVRTFDAAGVQGCSGSPKVCTPIWSGATGGTDQISAPAVAGGRVYVDSQSSGLSVFDAAGETGCSGDPVVCSPVWTAPGAGDSPPTTPAVSGGSVYVNTGGRLYAFDRTGVEGCSGTPVTCNPRWTGVTGVELEHSVIAASSPSVAYGKVFVGLTTTGPAGAWAYDANGVDGCSGTPKTCQPEWVFPGGGYAWGSPAVANGVLYLPSGGTLYALDASGGAPCGIPPDVCNDLWEGSPAASVLETSPAVANGHVYLGAGDGTLRVYALPTDGG